MKNAITNANVISYIFTIFGLPAGIFADYKLYSWYKMDKNEKNGNITEKELLEKQIVLEKRLIEKLRKDKTISDIQGENDYEIIDIDTYLINSKVKKLTQFFYNLGFEEKKLYKNYLADNLKNYYSGQLLKMATEYFEEKGPKLAKKYGYDKNSIDYCFFMKIFSIVVIVL